MSVPIYIIRYKENNTTQLWISKTRRITKRSLQQNRTLVAERATQQQVMVFSVTIVDVRHGRVYTPDSARPTHPASVPVSIATTTRAVSVLKVSELACRAASPVSRRVNTASSMVRPVRVTVPVTTIIRGAISRVPSRAMAITAVPVRVVAISPVPSRAIVPATTRRVTSRATSPVSRVMAITTVSRVATVRVAHSTELPVRATVLMARLPMARSRTTSVSALPTMTPMPSIA